MPPFARRYIFQRAAFHTVLQAITFDSCVIPGMRNAFSPPVANICRQASSSTVCIFSIEVPQSSSLLLFAPGSLISNALSDTV